MGDIKRPKDKPTLQSVPHYRDEEDERPLGNTLRMTEPPGAPSKGETLAAAMSGARAGSMPHAPSPPRAAGKSIELFVIDETQLPGSERKPWRAAEIWTKRRVYGLDSSFKCFEILARETGRLEAGHELVGARLGGGRLREVDTVRFSYPYPLPGMEAIFMKGKKHGYTSPVERMIVRVRVLHTAAGETLPTWDEIASRWSEPPPR